MVLIRIFASVWKFLFTRAPREKYLPAEECVIVKRLRELKDVTPQISPTLSEAEDTKGAVEAGGA